jgi:uncharacterized membrane protein YcaP (DUF421 family)
MDILKTFFGEGHDLNTLQMSCRAIVSFFITLALIRIAGIRTFGKKSAFDNVVIIMLGSILSRVVVGASPFLATTIGCFAFVSVHWLLGWISMYNDTIGNWIKGESSCLYIAGREQTKNMRRARISHKDLMESIRLRINKDNLEQIREIFIERNGEISIVLK